jgi:hypothetical protein
MNNQIVSDPCLETIKEALASDLPRIYKGEDGFECSAEYAVYAFANANYNGMFSNLYAVLCQSPVNPNGQEIDRDWLEANDSLGLDIYDWLTERFTRKA